MPQTQVFFYMEAAGNVPALNWLDEISDNPRDKLAYRIGRLEQAGHELRRPEADFLRDGIYELRVRSQRVNYRLLYFFHGREAVIAQGCTKEGKVHDRDIRRAVERKIKYERNPGAHRYIPPSRQ
jgi:hypothetical protein